MHPKAKKNLMKIILAIVFCSLLTISAIYVFSSRSEPELEPPTWSVTMRFSDGGLITDKYWSVINDRWTWTFEIENETLISVGELMYWNFEIGDTVIYSSANIYELPEGE